MNMSTTLPFKMPDLGAKPDLIFVLAGAEIRKKFGLKLFRERSLRWILLSTGRFEIRKFTNLELPIKIDLLQIAAPIPPPQRHFFVCFEADSVAVERIPLRRFGTLSEIRALANWLEGRPEIQRILVVSSASHLRRVGACCRALLPKRVRSEMIPVPAELDSEERSEGQVAEFWRKSWIVEFIKILIYGILLWFRMKI